MNTARKITKCFCCDVNEAQTYDFRERYGVTSKYAVCFECLNRTDRSFFAKMRATTKRNRLEIV